jgi:hypothetical protein
MRDWIHPLNGLFMEIAKMKILSEKLKVMYAIHINGV